MYSPGPNKYIFKYISNMDDNNYTVVRTDAHKYGKLRMETLFLHNKKVALSNHNEKRLWKRIGNVIIRKGVG